MRQYCDNTLTKVNGLETNQKLDETVENEPGF